MHWFFIMFSSRIPNCGGGSLSQWYSVQNKCKNIHHNNTLKETLNLRYAVCSQKVAAQVALLISRESHCRPELQGDQCATIEEHPTKCSSKKVFLFKFHLATNFWKSPFSFKNLRNTFKIFVDFCEFVWEFWC